MFKQRHTAIFLTLLVLTLNLACGGAGVSPANVGGANSNSSGGAGSQASKQTGWPEGSPRPRAAQRFEPGFNLFEPAQDIEFGKQVSEQMTRDVKLVEDQNIVNYIRGLGARLAAEAPGHAFPYEFQVLASREINAFALPGGKIYICGGAIEAARSEGELAGIIAHEIAHVALRHGTNQASKAYLAQMGLDALSGLAGQAAPEVGELISAIGGAGANLVFLKFGRDAESEADIEGAAIMAAAGYDPSDMANFFELLQDKGSAVDEFFSDHPNPSNRMVAIVDAARTIPIAPNPIRTSEEFEQAKTQVAAMAGSWPRELTIKMQEQSGKPANQR
jgi:predicted Zn-dependent protease